MKRRQISMLACVVFAASACVASFSTAVGEVRVPFSISISPTTNNFGKVQTGSASIPEVFTVTNTGSSAFVITATSFAGADPAAFEVVSSSCGGSLLPAASCSVNCDYGLKGKGLTSRSRVIRGKEWVRVLVPFTADQKRVIERQLARGRAPRVKVTGFAQDAVKQRYVYLRAPRAPYPVTG